MVTRAGQQLRLATFGFDERFQEVFRLTFKGPGKGKALLVDQQSADFGIINLDSANSKELIEQYERRFPGRPAIRLSVKEPDQKDVLYVKKPAKIDAILSAIDNLINGLENLQIDVKTTSGQLSLPKNKQWSERQCEPVYAEMSIDVNEYPKIGRPKKPLAQKPDIKIKIPATKIKIKKRPLSLYYNPKDYLQSEIHSAVEYSNTRAFVVELWVLCIDEWKKIVFLPRLQRVVTTMSDRELRLCCSSPLALVNHKLYRHNEKQSAKLQNRHEHDKQGISYEAFLWKTALYASQGRLPDGARIDAKTQLKHWPNLTRLEPMVGAVRIASLLTDQPRTLPLVAKVLNIPVGQVFDFYSAACAIGLVGNSQDFIDLTRQNLPQRHPDHTLLGQILRRLKKNSSRDTEIFI